MVCWRYASSRVVVAGLGRMGNATGFRPRSCARTRRQQAHDYRRRAGLLRAREIGSVDNNLAAYRFLGRLIFGSGSAQSLGPLCPHQLTCSVRPVRSDNAKLRNTQSEQISYALSPKNKRRDSPVTQTFVFTTSKSCFPV